MEKKIKIKLNARQKQILLYFLEAADYAPLNALADRLNVSLRTLQRELSEMAYFIAQYGIWFDKKIGVGLKLLGNGKEVEELAQILSETDSALPAYSADERQSGIKQILLSGKEPKKLYALSKELNAAESTISYDLQRIEPWFEQHGIQLHRKPGIGVYIEGSEKSIREALVDLLYENVTQEQLMEFMYEESNEQREKLHSSIRRRLLNFIDPQWLLKIEQVIQEFEQNRGYRMADNAYVGFVVHLAMAVQRLKMNESVTIENEILDRLKSMKEFETAEQLASVLSRRLELTFPESEIGYITMHILGARSNHVMGNDFDYSLTLEYVRNMIGIIEQELKLELETDNMLVQNLTTHLNSAVKRIELGMAARNPLLQHVKEEYPEIFKATAKAAKYLEQQVGKPVPEEEIGYLAIHFGTAILNKQNSGAEKYRVLLVCSSGIGTSRLLQAQIKKKLPELQVMDSVSLFDLDDWLANNHPVDLILSTLPVHLETSHVFVVSPFLSEEDIAKLREKLPDLQKSDRKGEEDRSGIEDTVDKVDRFGKALAALLDNIEVADHLQADSKQSLIMQIMELVQIRFRITDIELLRRDLERREEQGPLLVEDGRLAMLHCRSKGISELAISIIRLDKNVIWQAKGRQVPVSTVLTILVPLDTPKEYSELVGEISMSLIEDETLIQRLATGSAQEVVESLRFILKKGYIKLAGELLR
ncbi:transcription antiterminator [Cohnella sp.]|uniref:BglG family transcription antiterminator n=1 Tax=Cohnella sp. TaxID=1883426 RepID=UPI0035647627